MDKGLKGIGVYRFPPSKFSEILNDFSNAVKDECYDKIDYDVWRKLKTSNTSIRIVLQEKNGLTFSIYPDYYDKNNSCDMKWNDMSLGEYLWDYFDDIFDNKYKVVPIQDNTTATINANNLIGTAATATATNAYSPIDGKITNSINLDRDEIKDLIHKEFEKNNTFNYYDDKKGNKKMKAFNFDFGPCTNDNIRMSMYGLAVKNAAGTWVSYNPESKEIIDVDVFNFDGGKFLYKMPVAIKDIKAGDVVVHARKAMFVVAIGDNSLTAVDPQAGEKKEILLTKSPFGFDFATRVVSLFNMTSDAPTPDAPFGNMLPFLMLSENDGEFDMNTMLMLSMMGGQGGMDFTKNPMMMYFLMKDTKNMDEILPLMFMGNLCK